MKKQPFFKSTHEKLVALSLFGLHLHWLIYWHWVGKLETMNLCVGLGIAGIVAAIELTRRWYINKK